MTTPSTMAVSILCRALLTGPQTALTTAYRGRDAWLLTCVESPLGVSLLSPGAVLLPQSIVMPALPAGRCRVSIGDGALWYDDVRVTISRWFTPARAVRGALRRHGTETAVAAGVVEGWRDHLGEGPGLTPYGDDEICGAMLGLIATDHPDADRLATEILASELDARTTPVSAALLRCAADGWCIPEVERLLVALETGVGATVAVDGLLAVGHSSGHGLLAGLASVLDLSPLGLAA